MKQYESIALAKFPTLCDLKDNNCGLFVNTEYPYLSATPDGVFDDKRIVEVKSPYSGRNSEIKPGKYFRFLDVNTDADIILKLKIHITVRFKGNFTYQNLNFAIL